MHALTKLRLDRQTALWDATIPKRAKLIEVGETHTTYLHPTKGYRCVSNARLGF